MLQDHGRTTNAALARAVGLTPPAVLERVRRLEQSGFIVGYRATLDRARLGFGLTVLLSISLTNAGEASINAFREAIAPIPEIVECHYVTGDADFVLKVTARDVPDYRRLVMTEVARLPGVRRVVSFVVLETVKDSPAVQIPE